MTNEFPPTIVGRCRHCDILLQSQPAWQAGVEPRGLEPGTWSRHGGFKLCYRDYNRLKRNGNFETIDPARRRRPKVRSGSGIPAEEVLEDWELLRSEGLTIRQAAPRIGMSINALEKALERARKRGDRRGLASPHGTLPIDLQEAS